MAPDIETIEKGYDSLVIPNVCVSLFYHCFIRNKVLKFASFTQYGKTLSKNLVFKNLLG